jgi:hypothetical protein
MDLSALEPARVLCEGTFDAKVIQYAIDTTHPHLKTHLKVVDFEFNREGGSAALSRLVRGLAAVGISPNVQIFAVFDADRVGTNEALLLANDDLPGNFKPKTYRRRSG